MLRVVRLAMAHELTRDEFKTSWKRRGNVNWMKWKILCMNFKLLCSGKLNFYSTALISNFLFSRNNQLSIYDGKSHILIVYKRATPE